MNCAPFKVVYVDSNFIDKRYPNSPQDGDKFFTYGFGSLYARKFKKYNPDIIVECWKADSRIKSIRYKTIEGVKHIMFPSICFRKLGYYSWSLLKHLENELQKNEKIIFNVSNIRHLLFYSVALKLKNAPLVVQHHGEASAIYKTKINKGLKKLFYALQITLERRAFKNMDLFFVLDERIKPYLPQNNRNLKIEVSTTGVDDEIFYPIDKIEAKKILGWDINKKHVLYVGRLNYTKRPDILIDIYKELKEKDSRGDIEIVFAGAEKDDPLYTVAEKSGIKIYPKILQTELYKYLSAANVYCLPKYKEDMAFLVIGMLPIQALLCNTPIIGGNLSNFSEENVHKVGIIVETKDDMKEAIVFIIDGKRKFENLREIAIKHFSWETISKRTREHYDSLIENYIK